MAEKTSNAKNMPPPLTKREMRIRNAKKNSTSGREKGENCQASPYDKGMTRSNRSHKDKNYSVWLKKMDLKYEKYK